MRKIVVFVSHFDRKLQAERTLKSIYRTKHDNYQVVFLDHNSSYDMSYLKDIYPDLIYFNEKKPNNEWGYFIVSNNKIMYWILQNLNPDILVCQEAECYHIGDVIMHANDNTTDENYISYGAFSTDEETTFRGDFEDIIEELALGNKEGAWGNGVNAWYNHPTYRRVGYGFCCSLSKNNMVKLNWWDERFKDGIGFSDDNQNYRMNLLGLNTEIVVYPFVVHQWHYDASYKLDWNNYKINSDLHNHIRATETDHKAKHLITPNFDII